MITGKLSTIEQLLSEDNLEGQPGICILGPLVNEIDKMVLIAPWKISIIFCT